jgi:hypothetical protein
MSMAVGRDLSSGIAIEGGPLRVLILNAEEPQDELDRRLAALRIHYTVTEGDCGGRLFVQSIRDRPLRVATLVKNAPTLDKAVLTKLKSEIEDKRIDVWILDPFVSFHGVAENDNSHMDLVLKEGLGAIADATNSAGEIAHHPGKPKPGLDTTVDDGRGASAIIWAVRHARVLNFMATAEAFKLGIAEDQRRMHIRIENGKANMAALGTADWVKLVPKKLPNGDEVVCVTSWRPPNPFSGVTTADMQRCRNLAQCGAYRADSQAKDWFGYAVADVLKIEIAHRAKNDPKDVTRVKEILKTWLKNKVLATEKRLDGGRHERDYIIPGPWSPEEVPAADYDDELTLQ